MKKSASVYRTTWISILATALAAGFLCSAAMADTLSNVPAETVITPQPPSPSSTPATAQAPALAFGVSEVVKMYQGGISKDVIISYIDNTSLPFHLTADGIIYLQHLGVPQEVTSALIRRDGQLQREASAAYQQQAVAVQQQDQATAAAAAANQPAAGTPGAPVVLPNSHPPVVSPYPQTAPTVVAAPPVVYPDYDVYPYYGYPYYYGPDVIIGGGWGWGWGRGGWGPGWGGRGGFGHGGFGGGHGGGHR